MGFVDRVADRIRELFVTDKDRKALDTQRGVVRKRDQVGQSWSLFNRSGYEGLAEHLQIEHDLMTRYADYEEMDDAPEISTAVDIFADDATQVDGLRRKTVWVVADDERYKRVLEELFQETIRIEEDVWSLARTVTKYGNAFGELLVNEKGVIGINFLPPPTMRRVEDMGGALLGFYQDPDGRGISVEQFKSFMDKDGKIKGGKDPDSFRAGATGSNAPTGLIPFEDWEIVHWRLRSKHMRSIYGHSVLEPARWVFRRLALLEDAAILYKLTRAPARYAFYIDTGDLPPAQAMAHVADMKRGYKKKKYIDKNGNLDFRVNPLGQDEDFWVPMRGGKESTRIDVLSGADWQSMEDLQYFRQKLMTALKVPPGYIGLQEGDTKASLSQEDVRFARTVIRIQREVVNGLKKVARVHLAAIGLDPHAVKWDIHMTVPSAIFELAQIEVRSAQADLAGNLEPYFSKNWIMKKVFNLSDDEAESMIKAQDKEQEDVAVRAAEIQKKQAEVFPGAEGAVLPQQPPGEPGGQVAEPQPAMAATAKHAAAPSKKESVDDILSELAILEAGVASRSLNEGGLDGGHNGPVSYKKRA